MVTGQVCGGPAGFGGWDDGGGRRPLSPRTIAIVTGILGLHLAGAAYLYTTKIAQPAAPPITEGPIITATPIRLHDDPPPKADPAPRPPRPLIVHQTVITDPTQTTTTIELPKPPDATATKSDAVPTFTDTAGQGGPRPPEPPRAHTIENPHWLARPTPEQLAGFYPPRALDDGISGQAILDCKVTAQGQLTQCAVSGETPPGRHFGEAALKAARIFRMSPKTEDGQPVEGGTVHIPIKFAVAD